MQDSLSIWRPIPPSGYVAIGMAAATGHLPPSVNVMRCIRADAATSVTLSRDIPDWMSSPARQRVPLYAWITDERCGTFLSMSQGEMDGKISAAALMAAVGAAGVQKQAPKLEAWRARLGDEEEEDFHPNSSPQTPTLTPGDGERIGSPSKHDPSGGFVAADEGRRSFKASSIELRCPKASLLLRNTQRTPIAEIGALDVRLGVGSQSQGVTRGFAFLTLSLCTYQPDMGAWEPLLEPWQLLVHLDQSKLSKMSKGVSPGTLIRATSTQSTVNMSLAYGPTTVLLANMPEWSLASIATSTTSSSSSSANSGSKEAEAIAAAAAKQLLLRQVCFTLLCFIHTFVFYSHFPSHLAASHTFHSFNSMCAD